MKTWTRLGTKFSLNNSLIDGRWIFNTHETDCYVLESFCLCAGANRGRVARRGKRCFVFETQSDRNDIVFFVYSSSIRSLLLSLTLVECRHGERVIQASNHQRETRKKCSFKRTITGKIGRKGEKLIRSHRWILYFEMRNEFSGLFVFLHE